MLPDSQSDVVKKPNPQPQAMAIPYKSYEKSDDQANASYPEAIPNYTHADAPPVTGAPLYPEEAPANQNLARFVKQGFQDIWAAALFVAVVLMTLIWSIVNMATYKHVPRNKVYLDGHPQSGKQDWDSSFREYSVGKAIGILIAVFVASIAGAIGTLVLLSFFPKQMIYVGNLFIVVYAVIAAVFAFAGGNVVAGIFLVIMCLMQALWLYLARGRIPFAAELLRCSMGVLRRYKAILLVNLALAIVFFGYMILWGFVLVPSVDRIASDRGRGSDGFIIALFVLIFFWVAEVVPNTMHVTTSGVVATWYFAGIDNMPPNPTLASLKRAITTSFGSICFGSLMVALIQFLRWLIEVGRQNDDSSNFLICIFDCLLSCIERMLQYFNTYAFVHVAIYGSNYIKAAKETFALCKQCFFAAYFNDCLIQPTLDLLTLAVSALIGVLVGIGTSSWAFGGLSFFISLVVHAIFFKAVTSAVVTIFVCFAEAPESLRTNDPELYASIHSSDAGGTNNNAPPPMV